MAFRGGGSAQVFGIVDGGMMHEPEEAGKLVGNGFPLGLGISICANDNGDARGLCETTDLFWRELFSEHGDAEDGDGNGIEDAFDQEDASCGACGVYIEEDIATASRWTKVFDGVFPSKIPGLEGDEEVVFVNGKNDAVRIGAEKRIAKVEVVNGRKADRAGCEVVSCGKCGGVCPIIANFWGKVWVSRCGGGGRCPTVLHMDPIGGKGFFRFATSKSASKAMGQIFCGVNMEVSFVIRSFACPHAKRAVDVQFSCHD